MTHRLRLLLLSRTAFTTTVAIILISLTHYVGWPAGLAMALFLGVAVALGPFWRRR